MGPTTTVAGDMGLGWCLSVLRGLVGSWISTAELVRGWCAVSQNNFLLRGSMLRNTKWILGLVVYTGYDTKIVMNSR